MLSPPRHAGAHVVVGIAGQHRHSRALAASIGLSSLARWRALHIRFDPPNAFPPISGNSAIFLSSSCLPDDARQSSHTATASAVRLLKIGSAAPSSSAANRNADPSIHMRCMTTASLRATAATARPWPLLAAIRTRQALISHHLLERTSIALPAW